MYMWGLWETSVKIMPGSTHLPNMYIEYNNAQSAEQQQQAENVLRARWKSCKGSVDAACICPCSCVIVIVKRNVKCGCVQSACPSSSLMWVGVTVKSDSKTNTYMHIDRNNLSQTVLHPIQMLVDPLGFAGMLAPRPTSRFNITFVEVYVRNPRG